MNNFVQCLHAQMLYASKASSLTKIKWKIRNTTLREQFQNPNRKTIETKPTHLTAIHDRSLAWLATCTSIKGGGVKLICVMLDQVHLHPFHFLPHQ